MHSRIFFAMRHSKTTHQSPDRIWRTYSRGDPALRLPVAAPPKGSDIVSEGGGGGEKARPMRSGPKVGRNDPCPCKSGKKYKQCCGKL